MSEAVTHTLRYNPAYQPALDSEHRYLILYGGAGSGKSVFAAQKMLMRAMSEEGHRILITRKVAKTLRASTYQLLIDLLDQYDLRPLCHVRSSEMHITLPNGSELLHAGLDDVEKLKSIQGITSIWVEEASEITEAEFMQLDLRLRGDTPGYKQIILTFNPISYLLWHKRRWIDQQDPDALVLRTTYLDNRFLDDAYTKVLTTLQDDGHRAVYERGEWGRPLHGLIYPEPTLIDTPPPEPVYGLDFGYNNPTALIACSLLDGDQLHVDERLYQSHLTNTDLIERLKELIPDPSSPIYADSAEPQRIEEIARAGFNVHPADKDVRMGIDSVKARSMHVTRSSVNLMRELDTYKWSEDRGGNILDKPVKWMDHLCDALRYAVHSHWGVPALEHSWLIS